MEKETNQAIPLGGNTTDGTRVVPSSGGTELSTNVTTVLPPETLQKKGNPVVVVILGLAALLLVLLLGCGMLFLFATTDTMPKAPEVTADLGSILKDSAKEMIADKKISLNSDELNFVLKTLVEKSSEKLEADGIQVNDFFCVVANDKITFYCRLNYKGVTWPVKAIADVSYDEPNIIIGLRNANLGKLNLPSDTVLDFFGKYYVSDNITMRNGFIYYDTTDFNDRISEVAISNLGLNTDGTKTETDTKDDNKGFSLKKWWNKIVSKVSDSVKNWAAKVVSDFIHDVEFKDVKVIDNELVISVTYKEDDQQGDTTSSSDTTTEDGDTTDNTQD